MSNPIYEYTTRTVDSGSNTINITLGPDTSATASNWDEFNTWWSSSYNYSGSYVCPDLLQVELAALDPQWTLNVS
jgi:hypothetical protein